MNRIGPPVPAAGISRSASSACIPCGPCNCLSAALPVRSMRVPHADAVRAAVSMTLAEAARLLGALQHELRKVIVGQDAVVEEILIAFLAGGHCLLRGVPGLAKTLIIKTLADAVHLKFSRIQFTPDLMPSDILGTEVIEEDRTTGTRAIRFMPGPDLRQHHPRRRDQPDAAEDAVGAARGDAGVSGDDWRQALCARPAAVRAGHAEPDRAGRHLSAAGGAARSLHAQRGDRLPIGRGRARHSRADHHRRRTRGLAGGDGRTIEGARRWSARSWPRTTSSTTPRAWCGPRARASAEEAPDFVRQWVRWGAGPRAGQSLLLAGKARAVLQGRPAVSLDDIRAVAPPVLRHRVLVNFQAEADGVDAEAVVARLLDADPGANALVASRPRMSRPHVATPSELSTLRDLEFVARTTVEGLRHGPAPQPVPRLQRGVQPVSTLPARRRSPACRLEARSPAPIASTRASSARRRTCPRCSWWTCRGRWTTSGKFALAQRVVAVLGTLVLDQGDAAGLLASSERDPLPAARSGHRHLTLFLSEAGAASPVGHHVRLRPPGARRRAADAARPGHRGLGLLRRPEAVVAMRRLARMGHEVVVAQTLDGRRADAPAHRRGGVRGRRDRPDPGGAARAGARLSRARARLAEPASKARSARGLRLPARHRPAICSNARTAAVPCGADRRRAEWGSRSCIRWVWLLAATVALPDCRSTCWPRNSQAAHPFPTLRFLETTRLSAASRQTLQDWPLLAACGSCCLAAVAALAGPVLVTPAREAAWAAGWRARSCSTIAPRPRRTSCDRRP